MMVVNCCVMLCRFHHQFIKFIKLSNCGLGTNSQAASRHFSALSHRNNLEKIFLSRSEVSLSADEILVYSKRRFYKWQRLQTLNFLNYMKSLKWAPIPLGVGFGYLAFQQYRHVQQRERRKISESNNEFVKQWELTFYRLIPLRTVSRVWGWVNNIDLPVWARKPVLTLYANTFGCNLEEAETDDLLQYRNLGEFFRRSLKPSARNIHPGECLISPADGIVMNCGLVEKCCVQQVKGVSYSLDSFLGNNVWSSVPLSSKINKSDYHKALLTNPKDNELYYYVVYLAPGDYHRFHSPVEWVINFRRHFTGDLLSVKPGIAQWIPGLFTLNERAVYVGQWKHGFFSMTPVGATNVGSIKVYKDRDLQTNCIKFRKGDHRQKFFFDDKDHGIKLKKGEPFGEFNLGSTIVLIFEAPKNYQFNFQPGDRVQMGEALNICNEHKIKQCN